MKDLLNLHYNTKYDITMLVTSKIPWNRIWHSTFSEIKTKTSVFELKHIIHDQILHVRSNWLGPTLFSCHTKELLVLLLPGLEDVRNGDTNPKWRFTYLKFTHSNDRVFCARALSGHKTRNSWLGSISLKDYKLIWKIEVREMKTKQYLENLIVLWINWTDMVEFYRFLSHKDFYIFGSNYVLQNSTWIIGSRIYGEGKTQILLNSPLQ